MVKNQKDRGEFEGQDKKNRNAINYLKSTSEDETYLENTDKNKDYVWWLI